jgi:hypothetical protein
MGSAKFQSQLGLKYHDWSYSWSSSVSPGKCLVRVTAPSRFPVYYSPSFCPLVLDGKQNTRWVWTELGMYAQIGSVSFLTSSPPPPEQADSVEQAVMYNRCFHICHRWTEVILNRCARCAANIMKVYFKNEKKPICIEICIHSLINIFLILYMKCARKCLYVLGCAVNQKSLRTTALKYHETCTVHMFYFLRVEGSTLSPTDSPHITRGHTFTIYWVKRISKSASLICQRRLEYFLFKDHTGVLFVPLNYFNPSKPNG